MAWKCNIKRIHTIRTVLLYSSVNVSRSLKFFKQTKADVLALAYIKIVIVAEDSLTLEMSQDKLFHNMTITTSSHSAMVQQVVFGFKNSNFSIQLP